MVLLSGADALHYEVLGLANLTYNLLSASGLSLNADCAEVPARFRFKIKGTPTVAILDGDGRVLNRKAAPRWRNAASRSDDDIYNELMGEEN